MKFKVGTKAFIIESNLRIVEVQVVKSDNVFSTIKFLDCNGVIRLKNSRLYESEEEARRHIRIKSEPVPAKKTPRSPHSFGDGGDW